MGNMGIKDDLILRDLWRLLELPLLCRGGPPPPPPPPPPPHLPVGVNIKAGGKIRVTKAISEFPKSRATSDDRQPAAHPPRVALSQAPTAAT